MQAMCFYVLIYVDENTNIWLIFSRLSHEGSSCESFEVQNEPVSESDLNDSLTDPTLRFSSLTLLQQ